jgi:hypothetical protein
MNQAPPAQTPSLVPQPISVANPALPQTDWNAHSVAAQTVSAETTNIPNSVCGRGSFNALTPADVGLELYATDHCYGCHYDTERPGFQRPSIATRHRP